MTADILQNNNDEILVMDESGAFKVLSGGVLKPFSETASNAVPNHPNDILQGGLKPILPMDTGMEEKMIQPPPPMIRKTSASFYFHPEDEEEVAKHSVVGPQTLGPKKVYSLDKILAKIMENYQLKLSEELTKRLRLVIFSFLRDRRTLVESKEVFVRSENNGGLNFSAAVSDNLLEFLKEIKEKIKNQSGVVIDEQDEAGKKSFSFVPPVVPANLTKKAEPLVNRAEPGKAEAVKDVFTRPAAPIKPLVKDIIKPLPKGLPVLQRPAKSGAPRLTDVKKDYKLVGPVEELGMLNLETFRRLGEDTRARAAKVLSKINFLASESITKKTLGIAAWRACPLYRMYVAVGQASMEHDFSVEQVIKEYQAKGNAIITLEEFEAISDLNRQLRF
ncbi:MAG: hypothetical protein NTZ18_04245 [Candidatus Komeilibacteria bacterium]|nr:hypothetical protein [Candidatus Komeilibacteria bacterium]